MVEFWNSFNELFCYSTLQFWLRFCDYMFLLKKNYVFTEFPLLGMTGNISLNENGDRQQGYKIEMIQLTSQFQLKVGILLYNDKAFTLINYDSCNCSNNQ